MLYQSYFLFLFWGHYGGHDSHSEVGLCFIVLLRSLFICALLRWSFHCGALLHSFVGWRGALLSFFWSLLRYPVPFLGQGAGYYSCCCRHSHHHSWCLLLQREHRWNFWGNLRLFTYPRLTGTSICLKCWLPMGCGVQGDAQYWLRPVEGGEEWSFVG